MNTDLEGFLVINKPKGMSSFMVVNAVKKIAGVKKVGHGGTLDPAASGVLVIGIGRKATKSLGDFLEGPKKYLAEILLGYTSDTFDMDGKLVKSSVASKPSEKEIEKALNKFTGTIIQTPPAYSAKKIKGVRAYDLARQNKQFELKAEKVTVYENKLVKYSWPILTLSLTVSKGTYIRSIANDLGQELKTGAVLKSLIRTAQGRFSIENSVELENLTKNLVAERLIRL